MPTLKENIFWHKGLSWDALGALQQPGFLKECQNISLAIEGKQTLRDKFSATNSTVLGSVHSLKYWKNILLAGHGSSLGFNSGTGDFTTQYAAFSGGIFQFAPYKNFICAFNGDQFVLVDTSGRVYPARIDKPATAPVLTDSTSGAGPNGNYMGYVSFLITWPNGHTYETGLSSASSNLTIADNAISWSSIPVSTYAAHYGTAPTIYRKLYRGPGTGGTLGDIYYVATISDNTTTTYSDSLTDTQLGAADASYVDDYGYPPVPKLMAWHYGRAFIVSPDYLHRLYWTEVVSGADASENETLMPLAALEDSWDDMRVSGFENVDPQALVSWGVNLYIALKDTWIRKQGNDPDTWAYRKTYANHGIGAPYTVDFCPRPGGIIGVTSAEAGEPGIAIFGGQQAELISSPKIDYIFKHDLNHAATDKCRGKIAGRCYHLLYPSGVSLNPDKHLCLDLRHFPDIRVSEWTDLYGVSIDSDSQDNNFYLGGSDGYVRKQGEAGTVSILLQAHDLVGGDPKLFNEEKTWKELKYSLKGTTTLEVYIDDVLLKWPDDSTSQTLTGTGQDIQVLSFPLNSKGYKIALKLTGENLQEIEIYSPWELKADGIFG